MGQKNKIKTTTEVQTKIGQGISTEVKTLLGVIMVFAVIGMFAFAGMAFKGVIKSRRVIIKEQVAQYQPRKVSEKISSNIGAEYKSLMSKLEIQSRLFKKTAQKVRSKNNNRGRDNGVIEVDQDYVDEMGGGPLIFTGTTTVIVIEDLVFSTTTSSSSGFPLGFDLYDNVVLNGQNHLITSASLEIETASINTSIGVFLHDNSQAVACNVQNFGWGFGLEDYSNVSSSTSKSNMIAGIELIENSEASFVISENNYFGFVLNDNSIVSNSYASYNTYDGFYVGGNALIKDNVASHNFRHGYVCESGISLSNIAKNNLHGFYLDNNAEYDYCIATDNRDIGIVLGGGQQVVDAEGLFSCYNNNMDFLCIASTAITAPTILDSYGGGCNFLRPSPCPQSQLSDY